MNKNSTIILIFMTFGSVSWASDYDNVSEVDSIHEFLDHKVTELAQAIDYIVGGRKAWEEENHSYLEVGQEEYGGDQRFSQFIFRARLKLPRTNNRLHIFMEKQKDRLFEPTSKERISGQSEKTSHSRLGLGHINFKSKHFLSTTKSGVRVKGMNVEGINAFIEQRLRYQNKFSKHLSFDGSFLPTYYIKERIEYESDIHLEYSPLPRWLFRASNGTSWKEEDKIFNLSQGISAFFKATKKRVFSCTFSISSNDNSGFHLQSYQFAAGITQPIFWDWLILGTNLQVNFDKDTGFEEQIFYGVNLSTKFGWVK